MRPTQQSVIEGLELRRLLSGDLDVMVKGTPGDDRITVFEDSGTLFIAVNNRIENVPSANVTSLTIMSLGGNDFIQFDRNITPTVPIPTTINSGAGDDTIVVGFRFNSLTAVHGDITIRGGGGTDTLQLLDSLPIVSPLHPTYEITRSTFQRTNDVPPAPPATIEFSGFELVDVETTNNAAGSTINIEGVAPSTVLAINGLGFGGRADETINVTPESMRLSDIEGELIIRPGPGTDVLTINDQASPQGQDRTTITDTAVVRKGEPLVVYNVNGDAVEQFTYNAGNRDSQIQVTGLPATTALTLNGNNGDDLLEVDSAVTRGVTLNGGDGNDTLLGGSGDDSILGGRGNDILVGGLGVDRMFGQEGNDTLFGADGIPGDLLDGGPGRDVLGSADPGDIIVDIP